MPSTTRRLFCAILGTGLGGALGGCLSQSGAGTGPRDGNPETPTESPIATRSPAATRTGPSSKPVRCRGEPISVERTITDEPGYADDIEYFPSNGTVRFVSIRSGEEPIEFGSWTFEEWGSIECGEVGLERVRAVTKDRLGTDEFGSGYGRPPSFSSTDELVIWLEVATRVEGGETVGTPTIPLPRLADFAPRSADVTVSMKGDKYTRSVPVFAQHIEMGFGGAGGGAGGGSHQP